VARSVNWALKAVNWILLNVGDAAQWLWRDGLGYVGGFFVWVGDLLNPLLAPLFAWINHPVNAAAGVVFAPIGVLPGWLSATLVSAVTGVLLLIVFKYTSNQHAIGQVRDRIKADLLALKLFKEDLRTTFRAQGRLLVAAMCLLRHSIRPLLVMIVPVLLELAQLGLWYQRRPLAPGEEALVTLQLAGEPDQALPEVQLESQAGVQVTTGPVRIFSKRQVCWQVRAVEPGEHALVFNVGGQQVRKQLVVGNGFARTGVLRPGWRWTDILLHPLERPFRNDSAVTSIEVDYPARDSFTSGTDWWVVYFFIASMVFALLFKPFMKVRI
jgi:uncharacterized membrane protein (DUF106 family)